MNFAKKLISEIHDTPYQVVAAITGGGCEFIGDILKYGGGSSTLLEATVPYNQKAFDKYVNGKPDKYCSYEAAMELAMASYQRACKLDPSDGGEFLIGIGVTCSLNKPDERLDRENVAYIAFQTYEKTICYKIQKENMYAPNLLTTRENQEKCVSDTILYLLGLEVSELASGTKKKLLPGKTLDPLSLALQKFQEEHQKTYPKIYELEILGSKNDPSDGSNLLHGLILGNSSAVVVNRAEYRFEPHDMVNRLPTSNPRCEILSHKAWRPSVNRGRSRQVEHLPDWSKTSPKYIFPGSFNPLHSTHKDMAVKVYEMIRNQNQPCLINFEICVNNVDKPPINYYALKNRLHSLFELRNDAIGDVYLTSLPTFMDKANYFYNATFIVGWDTLKRICDPKYANLDEVFDTFEKQQTKFIVFHRIINGVSSADEGTEGLDPRILKFVQFVSPESLPPNDVSSSSIRSKK